MSVRPFAPYLALAVVGAACAALFAPHFENANVVRPHDYVQYWSAGRAVLNGQNPYDGKVLSPYQLQIGPLPASGFPVMMWNPPWTLPATMALGTLHWRTGQLLWIAANLAAVVVSSLLLWRTFGGNRQRTLLAALVALGFGPTFFLVINGQISGFVLLGVAGFLACVRSNHYTLAGVFLAFTAIKPHLLAPFAMVIALEAIRCQPLRKTLVAGIATLIVCGTLPMLWDAEIWSQYRAGTSATSSDSNHTLSEWVHPTFGFLVREAWPGQPRWAMFVPLMIALPLIAVYWRKRSAAWNWADEAPRLILVSLLASPYGAWGYDLVLLIVPIVHAAARISAEPWKHLWLKAAMCYGGLNAYLLVTMYREDSMCNYWLTSCVTAGYLLMSYAMGAGGMRENATTPQAQRWETVPQ